MKACFILSLPRCILPVDKEVAGVNCWFAATSEAEGQSVSLYEKNSTAGLERVGDPIADVYAVVARSNHGILAIADGCNWGEKPRLAGKCAVQECMQHLSGKLYGREAANNHTTHEIFNYLLRSFDEAHKSIVKHGGTTTTLTAAAVCPLLPNEDNLEWCVCIVSVGDSQGYVYKGQDKTIHELTRGVHVGERREMRDSGGCLGMCIGDEPDLRNLYCTFSPVEPGDIVFLCTDGLSDNFDPVVRSPAVPEDQLYPSGSHLPSGNGVPVLSPLAREEQSLATMAQVIHRGGSVRRVADVIVRLLQDAVALTDAKRGYLEQVCERTKNLTGKERREMDRVIRSEVKQLPGKLDHCTIVGYRVMRTTQHPNGHLKDKT